MYHLKKTKEISGVSPPSTTTEYIQRCYKKMKEKVIGFPDSRNLCIEKDDGSTVAFALLV